MPDTKKNLAKKRLEFIVHHFDQPKRQGDGSYHVCCPAHDDGTPSLHISIGSTSEKIVFHCFGGCPKEDLPSILENAGLTDFDPYVKNQPTQKIFTYFDDDGTKLSRVVRIEPTAAELAKGEKSIRLERYIDKTGLWKPGLTDKETGKKVKKVIYNKPAVLAAGSGGRLYWTEGEPCAQILIDNDILATTSPGGSGQWDDSFADDVPQHTIVILPDNDTPGHEYAYKVARSFQARGKRVKMVDLPGLAHGEDVVDWLASDHTIEELKTLVDKAKLLQNVKEKNTTAKNDQKTRSTRSTTVADSCYESNSIQDNGLDEKTATCSTRSTIQGVRETMVPFPIEVFPDFLGKYIQSVATVTRCPIDYPACTVLAVLSTMIGSKRCISITPSWKEYCRLWILLIGDSGGGKSPGMKAVRFPLLKIQEGYKEAYDREMMYWKELPDEVRKKTEKPFLRQIYTTDSTVEAIKVLLVQNPTNLLFYADEILSWLNGLNQYKGTGNDRQFNLSLYDGDQVMSNRKGENEPVYLDNPFLSLIGGIQPSKLPVLIKDGEVDGLDARFLKCYPDPLENRDWPKKKSIVNEKKYEELCNTLFKLQIEEKPIRFSLQATDLWEKWVNEHGRQQLQVKEVLQPSWAKNEGQCLRLTLLMNQIYRATDSSTTTEVIDSKSINAGVKLIEYFKSHSKRAYMASKDADPKNTVGKALQWIKDQDRTVTARELYLFRKAKDNAEAIEVFEVLQEQGHGTYEFLKVNGKPSHRFTLNGVTSNEPTT